MRPRAADALVAIAAAGCGRLKFTGQDHDAAEQPPPIDLARPIDSMVMCGGVECMLAHASASCVANTCVVSQCDVGYADCNTQASDGCEVSLTDPKNCGTCGNVCASGVCGTSVVASMATQPPDWTYNGNAAWNAADGNARLTDTTPKIAGTVIYDRPIVTDAFAVGFDFAITPGTQGSADGLAFMIETDGATAVGNAYAGLGVATLHGFGFELDTFNNNACGDASANHVGVDLLPSCGTGGAPMGLVAKDAPFTMRDGAFHKCRVTVASGAAAIELDGMPVVSGFALPGFIPGTSYYYGFGGANGGGADTHAIKNVSITFPTARCL